MTMTQTQERTPVLPTAPEDRLLAQRFAAVLDDSTVTGHNPDTSDAERWEFAVLLVAAARRGGWTPQNP